MVVDRLKPVQKATRRPLYVQWFLARPIDDENEHTQNDNWECF